MQNFQQGRGHAYTHGFIQLEKISAVQNSEVVRLCLGPTMQTRVLALPPGLLHNFFFLQSAPNAMPKCC